MPTPALCNLLANFPKTERGEFSAASLRDIGHAERGNLAVKANPHIALDVVGQVFGDVTGVEDHLVNGNWRLVITILLITNLQSLFYFLLLCTATVYTLAFKTMKRHN